MTEKEISEFENYSKIYLSLIELDENYEFSGNIYQSIHNIIKDAIFEISQDSDNFLYFNENKNEYGNITLEQLYHLKNRAYIENITEFEDEIIKNKYKILLFFQKIISNLEIINEHMKVLREKGSSLPIKISIKIKIKNKEPFMKYFLDDNLIDFEQIRDFLINAKNNYISQLDLLYKKHFYLRFLLGKQFRTIMKHLEGRCNIDSFFRYILNIKDNNIPINEGYKTIIRNVYSYKEHYELYNQNSFDSISTYIASTFRNNNITLEDHYGKIKINSEEIYKGIYLQECRNNSMDEYILELFMEKIGVFPISQNVLITNKETSLEEIQAFLYRAILCDFNTLFIVEINDIFSNHQQITINSFIDNLLSYKNKLYNEKTKKNIDKRDIQIYLDSLIVFVYVEEIKSNINTFINEMNKFNIR